MLKQPVFIVGPMGVGKTTIGKLLAAELRLPFVDSDRVLEERTGADIPWIFDVEGEQGFRRRESAVLADLCEDVVQVVATGGGIVLAPENRQLLVSRGIVVYLTADTDLLVARTSKSSNRPLLQVDDPRQTIERLLRERDPLYRDVADLTCDTASASPRQVAQQIARWLEER